MIKNGKLPPDFDTTIVSEKDERFVNQINKIEAQKPHNMDNNINTANDNYKSVSANSINSNINACKRKMSCDDSDCKETETQRQLNDNQIKLTQLLRQYYYQSR